jgi:hypothetical protein
MAIELDDVDRQLLDFEAEWPLHGGRKVDAIRRAFGWTATRYYAVLGALIELPAAWQYAPMTVKRALERRDAARASRVV